MNEVEGDGVVLFVLAVAVFIVIAIVLERTYMRQREEEAQRQHERERQKTEERARFQAPEKAEERARFEARRQRELAMQACEERLDAYKAKFRPLVLAEISQQIIPEFDEKRLAKANGFLHSRDAIEDAIESLHDDLLGLYREAVEGHLQALGAMSDDVLTEEARQALIDEQTQACADVGLQAIKRSDLVREMLSGDVSQAVTQDGSGDGVKIEKKRSWRELRGNAYRT